MEIIEKVSDKIEKEIDSAEDYVKCALEIKDERSQLAESFFKIASEKINWINLLHTQIVAIIEEYRKKEGEPPEPMKVLYNILHRKHIEHVAAVKGMLALYKES